MLSPAISLRDLTSLDDFRAVVELETRVWGYTDAEDVVPVPVLVITVKRGGILIGAFDPAGRMVGFVYSLPGVKDGRLMQWSHMLGVVDSYRNSGLGHRLKLEQRARALEMGLDLIEWTFDPMQALNAHLNFAKLGVVVEEYEENIYGDSSSPLHRGTPTDRFVAEWWIRSPRVEQRLTAGASIGQAVLDAPVVNGTRPAGEWLECASVDLTATGPRLLVEIPAGFTEMQARMPDLARAWRLNSREIFMHYLGRGYRVVEFLLDRASRRGWYILEMTNGK